MTDRKRLETTACVNCGRPRNEHWLVNYADGPRIGASTLVCPTAQFTEQGRVSEQVGRGVNPDD